MCTHHNNLALLATRGISRQQFAHIFVTNEIVDRHALDNASESMFVFPLYIYPDSSLEAAVAGFLGEKKRSINLSPIILNAFSAAIKNATPEDLFYYAYGLFHSPSYRTRYAEFLKIDFPRLPLTGDLDLFCILGKLGGQLVALHLMQSSKLEKHISKWQGRIPSVGVEKITYEEETVWIDKTRSGGFCGVPENVWNFYIGGYQVCEKWLKDRKGRKLTADDIQHYNKIVVALNETIRIMSAIDKVIDEHGGWPDAFALKEEGIDSFSASKVYSEEASNEIVPMKMAAEAPSSKYPNKENAGGKPIQAEREEEKTQTTGKEESDTKKEEYDFDDLVIFVRKYVTVAGSKGIERRELIKSIARELDFSRTGSRIRDVIYSAINAASRRGVSQVKDNVVYLYWRSIDEYNPDFLKDMFIGAIGNGWITRDDAMRAAARYLGFGRTGESIVSHFKSAINGLIRQDRLESNGELIRRC